MGTVFDQRPRREGATGTRYVIEDALRRMGADPAKATAEEWQAAVAITRLEFEIDSADVLDEQLAGFAQLLDSLIQSIDMMGT